MVVIVFHSRFSLPPPQFFFLLLLVPVTHVKKIIHNACHFPKARPGPAYCKTYVTCPSVTSETDVGCLGARL